MLEKVMKHSNAKHKGHKVCPPIDSKPDVDTEIAIVGSGFGGIGLAIKLKQAKMNSFTIFEQANEVGGTWRDNTYPGAACDVPSHLYSFSFEPNPNWTKAFAPQKEIFKYLQYCAKKHKLYDHIRFNTPIQRAQFIEPEGIWHIYTAQGKRIRARAIVAATGALNVPLIPKISGVEKFKGDIFHTAQWNHDVNLAGKTVAVVGTGASAIQVIPAIAPKVKKLIVLQRTPAWVMPKFDHTIGALKRWTYRQLPFSQQLARQMVYLFGEAVTPVFLRDSALSSAAESLARHYIGTQIKDADLRNKVTPNYRIGCKRVLLSDDYYQALARANVDVKTTGLKAMTAKQLVTSDDTKVSVDAIILATGFKVPVASAPFEITGIRGKNLNQEWNQGSEAYKGINVSGYPNMALIMGPNTGPGNTSVIFYIESQINYIMKYLRALNSPQVVSLDVQPGVQERFNQMISQRMKKTVWTSGCQSWYLTKDGRNTTLWPGFSAEYRLQTSWFSRDNYQVTYVEPSSTHAAEAVPA
jgi:cation diffusion facilitator CzcD-associated flavoprotein CzcO